MADNVTNWKAVSPEHRKKIGPIVRHYMKQAHPFTACVNDNTKRFGPDRAKRICAVVKDMGARTTKWRKGGGRLRESAFDEDAYVGDAFDEEWAPVLDAEAVTVDELADWSQMASDAGLVEAPLEMPVELGDLSLLETAGQRLSKRGKTAQATTKTRGGANAAFESQHPRGRSGDWVLKQGASGEDVRTVQRRVGAKADGSFGAMTHQAVMDFQRKHGLQIDGVVGHQTATALAGHFDAAKTAKPGALKGSDRAKFKALRAPAPKAAGTTVNRQVGNPRKGESFVATTNSKGQKVHRYTKNGKTREVVLRESVLEMVVEAGDLSLLEARGGFNPNQARDRMGRWRETVGKAQALKTGGSFKVGSSFEVAKIAGSGDRKYRVTMKTPPSQPDQHVYAQTAADAADAAHGISPAERDAQARNIRAGKSASESGGLDQYRATDGGSTTHRGETPSGQKVRLRKETTGAWVVEKQDAQGRWLPNRFNRDEAGRKAAEGHFLALAKGGSKGAAKDQAKRMGLMEGALALRVGEDMRLVPSTDNTIRESFDLALVETIDGHSTLIDLTLLESGPGDVYFNADGTIDFVVIRPSNGRGMGNRIYEDTMLRENAHVWAKKVCWDNHEHPDAARARLGIPRPPSELAGEIQESWWDETYETPDDAKYGFGRGAVIGRFRLVEDMERLVRRLPRAVKTSINATATGMHVGTRNGKRGMIVEGIVDDPDKTSVDLVTKAGAGGQVAALYREMAAAA